MTDIMLVREMGKCMIIVRMWEGLGNQMFQYAYARVLSLSGCSVCLDLSKAYDEFFVRNKKHRTRRVEIQRFHITLECADFEKIKKYRYLERKTFVDKVLYEMSIRGKWYYNFWDECDLRSIDEIKGNCYVKGWFQNPSYFEGIREILLKEFTPKKKIKITSQLKSLLNDRQTVSIHVRRTDYVSIHNALNWEYYDKAILEMKKYRHNPIFVVFTDDYEWAKQHMDSKEICYFIDENESLEDYEQLLVMSCCNSNIIANSTFSWWAAWLNQNPDKIVIMPKKWMKGQEKLMMKDWIII